MSWSLCSKTCDGGSQFRSRRCDSPTPANGGAYCEGEPSQFKTCNHIQCKLNINIKGGLSGKFFPKGSY